ncbi:acyltransferase family protein [Paenibacillus aquistagni]|uniref:Peptidoglycan/LPS O-acetylase OafA/YrhL, contains acyltransferase and SGNH-hydrolase domains n=1 Tax=Paenibacillus aquistagni TaxID=1852522 RepID=A0A1X7KYQ9_9BACL|nr:acyltransferase [Paenibacillus aquistagni]SMG46615.1 Peptidoglycan/LPS O-acetylase OafA/YrhL, contains acyltransferase and SGNH-hydrolase domains [Paenibacillus aquistagni]
MIIAGQSKRVRPQNAYLSLGDLAIGRNNNFDVIRFIAATMVLYYHAFPLGEGNGQQGEILYALSNGQWNSGGLAVATFFIVSGFLITQSYENSKSIITFAKSRVLRIFPGLLIALLLSTFVLGPIVTSLPLKEYFVHPQTYQYLRAFFLFPMEWFLPGVFETNVYQGAVNGSLWTIPFEVICYIVVAILGAMGMLRFKKMILLISFVNLFYYFFQKTISPSGSGHLWGLEISTLSELFVYFSFGMLFYIYRSYIPLNKHLAMLSIFMLFISLQYGGVKELFILFGTYLIFYFAFSPAVKLNGFSKFGDFSYGLYIYAFPIQQLVTHCYGGSMDAILNFVISFSITILISILSWHLVEKPALKLKKYQLIKFNISSLLDVLGARWLDSVRNRLRVRIKFGWKTFIVLFTIFILGFTYYNQMPSTITFPYSKGESMFTGGWLSQSPSENYRWINKSAGLELTKPAWASNIVIEGYIPETFVEINKVVVYMNEQAAYETALIPGNPLLINVNVQDISNKKIHVRLEFNSTHVPKENDADQREMSAMISKVYFQ